MRHFQHFYLPLLLMAGILASIGVTGSVGQFLDNFGPPAPPPSTIGQCDFATDCPSHLTCQRNRCIDPCDLPNTCGRNAECRSINHQPICSCGNGMVGDPFVSCRQNPEELCRHSPCGPNMICSVRMDHNGNDRAVCSCIDNHFADPNSSGCRPECVSNSECHSSLACINNRCENPCTTTTCGEGAQCNVVRGRPECSCLPNYTGDPYSRCSPRPFIVGCSGAGCRRGNI